MVDPGLPGRVAISLTSISAAMLSLFWRISATMSVSGAESIEVTSGAPAGVLPATVSPTVTPRARSWMPRTVAANCGGETATAGGLSLVNDLLTTRADSGLMSKLAM